MKKVIKNLLLAFALVSLGYGLGKDAAQRGGAAGLAPSVAGEEKVMVYYLRSSFRCITCNMVEALTDEIVRTEFAEALQAGDLEFVTVDYLLNTELAARYNVSGNMVVVARFEDGEETLTIRLDRVMELVEDREAFMPYVRMAIQRALEGGRP